MIFVAFALVTAIAAFVQGAIGVGFALIVAPVIALVRPDLLPVTVLVLMLPLNAWVLWRERGHLELPSAGWITLGRIAGTFAGLAILVYVSLAVLDLVIGVTTIGAAIAAKYAPRFDPNRAAFVSAGLITGVTETATGIGGPPLALVYQHYPAPSLRSTVALCFLVGELFSLLILVISGRIAWEQIVMALALVPAVAIGLALTRFALHRISAIFLRDALLVFAVVSGLVLVVQGLRM